MAPVLGPLTVAHGQGTRGVFITRTLLRITGDLAAAALLSQLIYWFDVGRGGSVRAGVRIPHRPNGGEHLWLAKADGEWWEECGVTAKQASRIADDLVAAGLVAIEKAKFDGRPCRHWRIIPDALEEAIRAEMVAELEVTADSPSGRDDSPSGRDVSTSGHNGLALRVESLTETFTNTLTTESPDLEIVETSVPPASNRADVAVGQPCPTKPITARWKDSTVELGTWADPVAAVFEMWVVVFEKNRKLVKLNHRRCKTIKDAIDEYGDGDVRRGVAVCLAAIRGATLDAFYAERNREYADPEHLLRRGQKADTRNNVEYFAGLWEEFVATGRRPVATPTGSSRRFGALPDIPEDLSMVSPLRVVEWLKGADRYDVSVAPRLADHLRAYLAEADLSDRATVADWRAALRGDGWPGQGSVVFRLRRDLWDCLTASAAAAKRAAAELAAATTPRALEGSTTR